MVYWLARSTSDREVVGSSPAGCGRSRIATVGQLLFAPYMYAWANSTLHPLGVGKWVPATAGKVKQVCATLLGARHVPERLCGGIVYLGAL